MTSFAPIQGLIGGIMMGFAVVLLMLTIGRITAVSSIVLNAVAPDDTAGRPWRLAFLIGLPLGALIVTAAGLKDWSSIGFATSLPVTVVAGLLVGFGAIVGSGCTSGHGICGLARISPRSIVATATFMATGAATVFVVRHVIEGIGS